MYRHKGRHIMARITKGQLENALRFAGEAAGWDLGPAWAKDTTGKLRARVGAVHLAKGMGGWDVHIMANEAGGIRQVNGWCNTMKASEMLAFLRGVELGAKAIKGER